MSPGCDHCYAKTFAERWRGTEGHYFENGFDVQLRPDKLDLPLRWRKPKRVFVNSMSDLFHDDVPDDYIAHVFAVMQSCAAHTFQVLTKRHGRMRSLLNSDGFWEAVTDFGEHVMRQRPSRQQLYPYHGQKYGFLPNVWLGVSAETQQWADIRIPALLDTPAAVRFVSAEPLLGPIDLRQHLTFECPVCYRKAPWTDGRVAGYDGADANEYWCQTCGNEIALDACQPQLHWVIGGGESGRGARPMQPEWARGLRDQCVAAGTAFLFKQWGEYGITGWRVGVTDGPMARMGKKNAGRELDGRTWDQYPEAVTA